MKVLLPIFLSFVCASATERLTCPANADTWVTIQGWDGARPDHAQAGKPHGKDQELILQGRVAFALLTFDLSAARGMTIEKATLRVHRKPASIPLHTVGISTISGNGPWSEASANWFSPGGKRDWAYPASEPLTVFYPGAKFGQSDPFPSMRLKAYRRGQQDMEYLALLARKRGWDRDAVTHVLANALDLSGDVKATSDEDAGAVRFDNISDASMEELRLRVARALMTK